MAVYEWRGITTAGKEVKGVQDADNPRVLRTMLRKDGVLVTQVLEESEARLEKAREVDFGRYFRRVSTLDVALATRQLATLLKSGVPLVESLSALIDQMDKPELKTAFTQTRDKVNEGTSFADALKAHSNIFPPLYNNMVAAGEASGTLEAVLMRLADFLENQAKLKNKVTSALAYPAFMLLMGLATLSIMMLVVVPKVTAIFQDFEQALPWYTQMLIWMSDVFTGYWWLLLGMGFGAWYGFRRWRATDAGRERFDRFTLDVPLFGQLNLMVAVSRFSRTLATLLRSGVPLLNAMEITRNVLGNTELERVIEEARMSIREGESIAAPLKRSGRLPPIVTHMIAVGERSGQLEEMLENVADSYDAQVESKVATLTSLLEPMLIVVLGGMSAGIAFAILMPLMRINEFVAG
ncbi:MAG TPA: type II secretion system inner membrane protein GspF [Sandaracinaceae bacterium LLY-WYZ-13_1]|nr:type II secretion system inner membrane protein GspF [Sandaracinaceae bacterium LLY-WYZ-13_1]